MAIAPVIAAGQGQSAKGADAAAHEIGGQVGRTEPGKVSFEILEPGGPVCPIGGFERIRIGIDKIVRNLIRCRPPCRPCLTFAGAGPPEYPAGHGGIEHRFVLPMIAMRSAGQAKVPFQIIDQRMGNDVAGQMAEMTKRIGPDLLHLDLALAVPGRLVGIVDGFADLDQGGQVKPQRHIHRAGHHRLAVVIRRAFVDGVENPSLTGAEHLGKGGQVRPHRAQDRKLGNSAAKHIGFAGKAAVAGAGQCHIGGGAGVHHPHGGIGQLVDPHLDPGDVDPGDRLAFDHPGGQVTDLHQPVAGQQGDRLVGQDCGHGLSPHTGAG